MRCPPTLGGEQLVAHKFLKRYLFELFLLRGWQLGVFGYGTRLEAVVKLCVICSLMFLDGSVRELDVPLLA